MENANCPIEREKMFEGWMESFRALPPKKKQVVRQMYQSELGNLKAGVIKFIRHNGYAPAI